MSRIFVSICLLIALASVEVRAAMLFSYGSYSGDDAETGFVGDILLVAVVDYLGSPAAGSVAITTTTNQSGTDAGVPSDEGGAKGAYGNAWLSISENEATSSRNFTIGYSYYAIGSGSSHATPVDQTYYDGGFKHSLVSHSSVVSTASGGQTLATYDGTDYYLELIENDSFSVSTGASVTKTVTAMPSTGTGVLWCSYSGNVGAVTSYGGFNEEPAHTSPSHGVAAGLTVAWTFDVEPSE